MKECRFFILKKNKKRGKNLYFAKTTTLKQLENLKSFAIRQLYAQNGKET